MTRLLFGLAALPFVTTVALAAQPVALNDVQMDAVVAGQVSETSGDLTLAPALGGSGLGPQVFVFSLTETDVSNTSTVRVNADPVCTTCYLNITNGALVVQAQIGPTSGVSNSFTFQAH
ncbi:MAG TPA: hypothetical protein VGJ20_25275 [Xanthobacteraceae bacterium]|jgi:hypothetical protein